MSAAEKPRLTAGVGKARRWRSFPTGGARFPCAFGAAGETCKECLRLGAQTPRPPGGAGRYDFTWRAAALQTSDGWCGRLDRRNTPPGAACRVSCARWALETLACGGTGAGAHPRRERWARGRAYRDGSGRARRTARRLLRAHGPAKYAAGCGMSRFLRPAGARNARAACVRRKGGPCHSERRVGMGPARKRAAT